jgi:hypothetical protein
MNRYHAFKAVKVALFIVVGTTVVGFVIMHLWNWLMPPIFGLTTLTFTQALGLFILSKLLFGGFHRHSGRGRGWKRGMDERWAKMTPEDRERFRAGMRGRRGNCGWGPPPDPATEQTATQP